MTQKDRIKNTPLPVRMAGMDRDHRGYPIPANVLRDLEGRPVFTANSNKWMHANVISCTVPKCSICGSDLEIGKMAFLGGPVSAFHPQGAFGDGPLHIECAEYAAKVCPYLALPRGTFNKSLGLDVAKHSIDEGFVIDWTQHPDKPPVYIIGVCNHFTVNERGGLFLTLPYLARTLNLPTVKSP